MQWFFLVVSLVLGDLALGNCPNSDAKKSDYPYPVVLKGPAEILGFNVTNFKAYNKRGKVWSRIPLQIDEVNERGDYVLEHGLPFTKDSDDNFFDGNDELVFWGGDLGDGFRNEEIPRSLIVNVLNFWRLDFCVDSKRFGSVLLIATQFEPEQDPATHTQFDPKAGVISTSEYQYIFNKSDPVLLGEVFLKQGGQKHRIIESSRFLMPLEMPWFLPDMEFEHTDFESSIECWRTGPIRSIVAVGVKYKSFLSIIKLHLFSELVFYRNKFEIPTVIEFVFSPKGILNPGSGVAYSLTFPQGGDWQLKSNLAPLPQVGPETVIERGDTAAATEVFSVKGYRDVGSFMVNVRVEERARQSVPPPYLLKAEDYANKALIEHWPWLGKIPGNLGIYIDFSQVEKGKYDFGLDLVLSPKANDTFTNYGFVDAEWLPLRSL